MTFDTVSTNGTIKADLLDPASVSDATLDGDTLTMTLNDGSNKQSIGNVIELATGTASISGNITITLPYQQSEVGNIAENALTAFHYVDGEWKKRAKAEVDIDIQSDAALSFCPAGDKETLRTIKENPLRTLDSKSESLKNILHEAPKIVDYLDKESKSNFENLKELLDQSGLSFEVNESLVRGLDYYNSNVFEWRTTELGAQDAVCGGGRYDSLVELLGGKPCPAVGLSLIHI